MKLMFISFYSPKWSDTVDLSSVYAIKIKENRQTHGACAKVRGLSKEKPEALKRQTSSLPPERDIVQAVTDPGGSVNDSVTEEELSCSRLNAENVKQDQQAVSCSVIGPRGLGW